MERCIILFFNYWICTVLPITVVTFVIVIMVIIIIIIIVTIINSLSAYYPNQIFLTKPNSIYHAYSISFVFYYGQIYSSVVQPLSWNLVTYVSPTVCATNIFTGSYGTCCGYVLGVPFSYVSFNCFLLLLCIHKLYIYRGYYMAAWRYEISVQVLKNILFII